MSYRFANSLRASCPQTPDDVQRNCPKHVEFYAKNKFEKLVHLVGFIIRLYHDARSPERQIHLCLFVCLFIAYLLEKFCTPYVNSYCV